MLDPFAAKELAALQSDGLMDALLTTAPVSSAELERVMTIARRKLLKETQSISNSQPDTLLPFASSLAQQCFINEYVFNLDAAERAEAGRLRDSLSEAARAGYTIDPLRLAVLACYMPLGELPENEQLADRDWPAAVRAIVTQQIREPMAERDIRSSIVPMTAIEDATSLKVRAQYEESPYPRWTKIHAHAAPMSVDQYIGTQFPGVAYRPFGNRPLKLLVAGCGTGMHAITRARQFRDIQVTGIDLSLSSLSYAVRKTRELGIDNLDYAHADILALKPSPSFDVIDSSGVLHHLRDPFEGWRVLSKLLKPGGLMHIGLYSAIARRDIKIAREQLSQDGRQFSADEVRALRTQIMSPGHALGSIARFSDFFSMSECRDLLFHVQEHQLSIPQIADFLKQEGFAFLGFETMARNAYLRKFPQDKTATDLANWAAFENEHPATFAQMYQFWIQKT